MTGSITLRGYYATEHAKVLYLRHPQTVFNDEDRTCGQVNPPLSELGERQRDRAERALVAWRPTRIITSPLDRCRAIADPAAEKLGLEVEADPRFMELAYGALEGISQRQAHAQGLPSQLDPEWPAPGAETLEHMEQRVFQGLDDLVAQARQGDRIAIVAHGGVMRPLFSYVFKTHTSDIWFNMKTQNVASTLFSLKDTGTLCLQAFNLTPEELIARCEAETR